MEPIFASLERVACFVRCIHLSRENTRAALSQFKGKTYSADKLSCTMIEELRMTNEDNNLVGGP
jgi:hypothetical protein